jgi:NADPH-dependent F420 reductase
MRALAVVGGTGPEGLGLALRLAAAGEEVVIGSRAAERAEAAAATVRAAVPGARVSGRANRDAVAAADRIVLAIPFDGLPAFLDRAPDGLAGKLVVDVVVPLAVRDGLFEVAPIPGAPSAGELIQGRLPRARVVSAFKNVSAERLRALRVPLEGDVVLCGEDAGARAEVAGLVRAIPALRPVDAGDIRNARYVEAITALLLNLNRRHGATTSIAILGLG